MTIAGSLDFRIIVAAQTEDHERMKGADAYIPDFDLKSLDLGPRDAAIIATQGKRDRNALRAVIKSKVGYRGMICSRKKLATLKASLLGDEGNLSPAFDELHAPAGLNIAAIGPEEIALSIFTEIIAHRRQQAVLSHDETAQLGVA